LIGAELTIVQNHIFLVNKIQKVYQSRGYRFITSKILVSGDGIQNNPPPHIYVCARARGVVRIPSPETRTFYVIWQSP